MVNQIAVQAGEKVRATKYQDLPEILAVHRDVLQDDPQRLSTEFILAIARGPGGGSDA